MPSATLTTGPLTALWQPEGTFLRFVRLGSIELLRGIYVALRDENWGTIAPVLANYREDIRGDETIVAFDLNWQLGDIDFRSRVEIRGRVDGSLTYHFAGEAFSAFQSNRIGLLVLHAPNAAGKATRITHTNGQVDDGEFPTLISAHQPFSDIQRIEHQAAPGTWVTVEMEGSTFEMEDQRNWTDASFKTYAPPLAEPFPVHYQPGDRVEQTVTVRIEPDAAPDHASDNESDSDLAFTVPDAGTWHLLPRLGLETPADLKAAPWTQHETETLRQLRLDHLRVSLDVDSADFAARLDLAGEQAARLNAGLELALFANDETDFDSLAPQLLAHNRAPLRRILLFSRASKATPVALTTKLRSALKRVQVDAPIFAGTDHFFAELNRAPESLEQADGATFSINPQVHAFDDLSLCETLEIQATTVKSARALATDRPVIISPITFRMRANPNATSASGSITADDKSARVDLRQTQPFARAWTFGSLLHLTTAGAYACTYFETLGDLGVMAQETESPPPDQSPHSSGAPFPLFEALKVFGDFQGGTLRELPSPKPWEALGFELRSADHSTTQRFLVNLAASPQTVRCGDERVTLAPYEIRSTVLT